MLERSYQEEMPQSLDSAVQRLAAAYEERAHPLPDGDEDQWRRVAALAISQQLGSDGDLLLP